ncbi:ATP-binding cassette domain-containing protein [Nocardiopsis sp. CT-R113]|uniref:ATP-binding cassette domain-containing protein n=1 Tax=Nocardiopsis codii TaxID=3065942 RepID=A0ABU7KAR4_9ACTN|nr:ATP-binding cassette domain-containing protein [Nocardiopsis sp. CT-R113]MEE2039323.1 ATP-binding cassette domain-containing protein [Nocardiopsis sp. CT-R113]
MLTVRDLTKRYGGGNAVDGLTFTAEPGRVTGFLGPNGAGKSTTMRLLLGLARPTSGEALVNGRAYERLARPAREVGALLSPDAAHPGRTARAHLTAKAVGAGIPRRRVDEVLAEAGLAEAGRKRVGGFSLGMRQRLGVADALLGDPGVLLFDEPVNGLDLDGVRWMRDLVRGLADEGRTVFVSSHLMSEMEMVADHLVVVGRGRLITDAPLGDVIAAWSRKHVLVHTPDPGRLRERLERADPRVRVEDASQDDGAGGHRGGGTGLRVFGLGAEEVGDHAHSVGARVHGLRVLEASLEEAYLELTGDAVEYGSRAGRAGERTAADADAGASAAAEGTAD